MTVFHRDILFLYLFLNEANIVFRRGNPFHDFNPCQMSRAPDTPSSDLATGGLGSAFESTFTEIQVSHSPFFTLLSKLFLRPSEIRHFFHLHGRTPVRLRIVLRKEFDISIKFSLQKQHFKIVKNSRFWGVSLKEKGDKSCTDDTLARNWRHRTLRTLVFFCKRKPESTKEFIIKSCASELHNLFYFIQNVFIFHFKLVWNKIQIKKNSILITLPVFWKNCHLHLFLI